jgi:hypothetical protein
MRFTWVACQPNCRGWVAAVGIITADTPNVFEAFARQHQLFGATVVLNSSGGSVNDAIALGRRWRNLGMLTTVGVSIDANGGHIAPQAYCESMCVKSSSRSNARGANFLASGVLSCCMI